MAEKTQSTVRRTDRPSMKAVFWIIGILSVLVFGGLFSMLLLFRVCFIPAESMEPTLTLNDRVVINRQYYLFNAPAFNDVILFDAPEEATGGKENVLYTKRIIGLPGDRIQVTPPKLKIDGKEESGGEEGTGVRDFLRERLGFTESDALRIQSDGVVINGKRQISLAEIAAKLGKPEAKITLIPGKTLRNGVVLEEPFLKEDPDYQFPTDGGSSTVPQNEYFVLGDNRNHSADSHYWGTLHRDAIRGKVTSIIYPSERSGPVR